MNHALNKIILCGWLGLFLAHNAAGSPQKLHHIKDLKNQPIGPKTLVVWDLHYTLVEPKPAEFWHGAYDQHKEAIDQKFLLPWLKIGMLPLFLDYLTLSVDLKLIEHDAIDVLNRIEESKATQIAITKMKPGALGNFPKASVRTITQIKNLELTPILGERKKIDFSSFEQIGNTLFVKNSGKTNALLEWEPNLNSKYNHLIFIDDSENELIEMQRLCEAMALKCSCFHYLGKHQSQDPGLNWEKMHALWLEHTQKARQTLQPDLPLMP